MILLILAFGGIMSKGYDQILNMTNAVVRDAAETIDTYIYRITFQEKPKYGFSTAIGLSKSVINFAFLLLANKLAKAPKGIDGVTEGTGNVAEDVGKVVESGSSSGKVWDYSKQFDGELANFNAGYELSLIHI